MAGYEKDEVPMLSDTHQKSSDWNAESRFNALVSRTQSASISIPMDSLDPYESETNLVGYTGPLRSERKAPLVQMSGPIYINRKSERSTFGTSGRKSMEPKVEKFSSFKGMNQDDQSDDKYDRKNDHLLRSGQLGMCNDPYCTTCPTYYKFKPPPAKHSKTSSIFDISFHNPIYGDAKGWARRFRSFLDPYSLGVINPHFNMVKKWNKFFVICFLIAIFVDPLFFLVLSVDKEKKCIVIDSTMTNVIVAFRSITDFIYLLNMLLQFRLAYIAPESRVVGAGELVDHPKKIALHYLGGLFFLDLFIVLPLPQIIVLAIVPHSLSSGANNAKNILRVAILIQYLPKLFRFLLLLVGQSPSGFVFETARANFVINLLTFVLSGHIVGSCWYLLGLQRVNQCLRDMCHKSDVRSLCASLIDCGSGKNKGGIESPMLSKWRSNENATSCFTEDGFPYGIYIKAVNLTTKDTFITKYTYSLFWGFQQISTLAGNQVPSYFVWEVLFTMAIIGLGLLLFAFLVGNMQNFLLALGRRRLEMTLRRRDVEQWMSHRRLPQVLRRRVLEAERYNWAATRGVNEEMLMENLPEDVQRDIRRHLFKFVDQVWIFAIMDEHVLDAIRERLRQKIYIAGSEIFYNGGAVEKMVFIVRGKLESIGADGTSFLTEGNVCGEELLTWCLEHSSVNKDAKKMKMSGQRLISSRTVRCLTNVEAFSLRAIDLEEVTSIYARNLRNPRVQGAIRYESPYWRSKAARHIQVVWRYRQKRRKRTSRSSQV